MTNAPRDRRQFKAAPFQNPKVFPPPTDEAWAEVATIAPVKSETAARNQAGRTRRRGLVVAATRKAANTEFTEVNDMVALVNRTEVRAKEMVISPAVAKGWLEKMATNRRLSERAVDKYAADMRAGRWLENGSTIVMGKTGQILDGQHRLHAIVKADVPISMVVVSGVDDAAFSTIDTGRPRTVADVLTVMGYPNANVLAAVARSWLVYSDTHAFAQAPTVISNQEVLAVAAAKFTDFSAAISVVNSVFKQLKGASGVWAVLWLVFGEIESLDRDAFFEGLATGVELRVDSPVYALRRTLLERATTKHGRTGTLPANVLGAYIIKAWNKFRAHESVKAILWRADENFPEPI